MITKTRVDIITQKATAHMLCCLRIRILFSESLPFLNPVLGCMFLFIYVSFAGYSDSGLKCIAYERKIFYNLSIVS